MQLQHGFSHSASWDSALEGRAAISAQPAVYALLHEKPFGRLTGQSRILYVGSTGQLGGRSDRCRLRTYRYPNGTHARDLCARVKRVLDSRMDVTLAWSHTTFRDEAIALESSYLEQYFAEHGELPPFNGRK